MLKLNASYSKKVPAEAEYSSKSYHAAVEVELPDGLNAQDLRNRIHETFELVKESVETELNGGASTQTKEKTFPPHSRNGRRSNNNNGNGNHRDPASGKQIKYLLDLASQRGMSQIDVQEYAGVDDVSNLTRQECSKLIDEFRERAA